MVSAVDVLVHTCSCSGAALGSWEIRLVGGIAEATEHGAIVWGASTLESKLVAYLQRAITLGCGVAVTRRIT